mmetsp:Transcript_26821/g.56843  ORF Transcript_26821/g.56843 Transcript_26821/m.56843 type:complete len:298 (+) Transcript_26821:2421-3314(+)
METSCLLAIIRARALEPLQLGDLRPRQLRIALLLRAKLPLPLAQLLDAAPQMVAAVAGLPCLALHSRPLSNHSAELAIEFTHPGVARGRLLLRSLLSLLEFPALFRREGQLRLLHSLREYLHFLLHPRMHLTQLCGLLRQLRLPLFLLLSVLPQVFEARLHGVEATADLDGLGRRALLPSHGRLCGTLRLRLGEVRLRALPLASLELLEATLHSGLHFALFALDSGASAASLLALPFEAVQAEEVEFHLQAPPLLLCGLVPLGFVLLMCHPLPLVNSVPPPGEEVPRLVLLSRLLCR